MASSPKTAARRSNWKKEILDIIRSTPEAGRTFIKHESNLSMESTLTLINELMQEGLIMTTGMSEGHGAGRKAALLSIREDGCYFIGLRFNASMVVAVLINFGLRIVASEQEKFSSGVSREEILSGITRCTDKLIERLGSGRERLRGIGVGAPGLIDRERGIILRYGHIPRFENVALRDMLIQKYDVPVYMEHGVKCASRSILTMPEFADIHHLIFFQIGRGASMSAVIDGQVYNGAHYLAGEIGQMLCDNGETLENLLNVDAMLKGYRGEMGLESSDLSELLSAADAGDPCAEGLITAAAEVCAQAVSNAVMVMDPEAVLLSSAFCTCKRFCDAVRHKLRECLMPEVSVKLGILFLPHDPVLDGLGAAMLPYNHDFAAAK